jgi:NAD+ kinase
MPEPLRRIAVRTHLFSEAARAALVELGELGNRLGVHLMMPPREASKHIDPESLGYTVVGDDDVCKADLCLVFGGDGTVLRALRHLVGCGVPTLGVNYGKVGFLAALPRDGWTEGLEPILAGAYRVIELLTVDITVHGQTFTAVNDVVLSRTAGRHVLQLQYEVGSVPLGTMSSDGLIVSSPVGSTAYNLSCGGPLVEWSADVLVLNFIAPHSLAFRPVILHPEHTITARNISPTQQAEVIVDGEVVGRLLRHDEVSIKAGLARAHLMVKAEGSFYENVEQKLFEDRHAR